MYKIFRVAVLGGLSVGKTCIIERFVFGTFNSTQPTIEDTYEAHVKIDTTNILLQIIDSPGKEPVEGVISSYIKRADAFILVFSVTDKNSLNTIYDLTNQIEGIRDMKVIPIIFVANKVDVEKELQVVEEAPLRPLLEKFKARYDKVSAKSGLNIAQPFYAICKMLERGPKKCKKGGISDGRAERSTK